MPYSIRFIARKDHFSSESRTETISKNNEGNSLQLKTKVKKFLNHHESKKLT